MNPATSSPLSTGVIVTIVLLLIASIFFIIIFLTMRKVKSIQEITIPATIGESGFVIPTVAGYRSPSFIPSPIAIGHNNANSLIVIYNDKITLRSVFFAHTFPFSEIEKVSSDDKLGGAKVVFFMKSGSRETFSLGRQHNVDAVIDFFKKKGVNTQ